jgi:hypothetical protein
MEIRVQKESLDSLILAKLSRTIGWSNLRCDKLLYINFGHLIQTLRTLIQKLKKINF